MSSLESKVKKYESALQEIATGEIQGDRKNYRDTVYVMRNIAKEAIKDL